MGIETAIMGGLISAGGSLAGGMMTNATNEEIASSANATSIELANTAHQREVADLRAAGLNPILSAGGKGAAVPSMHIPQISNALGDAMSAGVTNYSALESSRQYNPLIDKIKSDTALSRALARKADAEAASARESSIRTGVEAERDRYGKAGWLFGSEGARLAKGVHTTVTAPYYATKKLVDVMATSAADATKSGYHKLGDVISNVSKFSARRLAPSNR